MSALAHVPATIRNAPLGDLHVANHPIVQGNVADLLVDTREFVPRIVEDLKGAKHQINVSMFSWQDDGAGRIIGDLLRAKAREGVEVNVMVDAVGSRQWPFSRYRKYIDEMAADGVNVRRNWPGVPFVDHSPVRAVDHRKLFEIDGKVAYLGGMNLAKKYDEWHDTMVRLEGPVAALAGAELVGRWRDVGGVVSAGRMRVLEDAFRTPVTDAGAAIHLLGNSPRGELAATDEFFRLAETARDRMWVMSPYLGDQRMIDALGDAARRGVDVRLLVPGPNKWKNGKYALQLSRAFYPDLHAAGVKIYEQPTMTHAKLWLADDTASISSVNLDRRSSMFDFEIGATIHDSRFRGQLEHLFERDLARSRQIPSDEVSGYERRARVRRALNIRV